MNKFTGELKILQLATDDHGRYVCHARNIAGEDQAAVLVNVESPAKITELSNITNQNS